MSSSDALRHAFACCPWWTLCAVTAALTGLFLVATPGEDVVEAAARSAAAAPAPPQTTAP